MLRPEGTDRNIIEFMGVNPLEVTHFKAGFLGIPQILKKKEFIQVEEWSNLNING